MTLAARTRAQRNRFHIVRALSALAMAAGAIGQATAQETGAAAVAKCLACHAVGPDAQHKNGPVLNGIAGKPVASRPNFTYSEAFQTASANGLIWTDDNLDKYLADPIAFLPGSRMAWAVPDAAERRAIITYLKTLP
jgi:cytochrome c